jgi:signal transduction histidine kinase
MGINGMVKIKYPKGVTARWAINSLSVILIVLIIFDFAFILTIKNYYYSSATQSINARANLISSLLVRMNDTDKQHIPDEIRSIVQNFKDKDKIEIMAIGHNNNIVLTSSGFSPPQNSNLPDLKQALASQNGEGIYIGKGFNNEKIIAVTRIIPVLNSEYGALRFVVSLSSIDREIGVFIAIFTAVCLAILLFVVISGLFFIKSIVIPVRQVSLAARNIAGGDFKAKLEIKSNDEIGELCEVINFMADELTASENIKNEFISSVSHELRTPLTAIKGWGETLVNAPIEDKDTLKKGMKVIISETERLSSMVEELLDFSRMQSGRLTLIKDKLDILAELGEAVLVYSQRAKADNIAINYIEPEMLPLIIGDKNRLTQVFINIIDNAIKYCDSGDSVNIEAKLVDENIEIIVKDTGCGISQSDLPFVKQKFYKANTSRRGSGIGLAVANEIVELHNGTLVITSEKDIGTTVKITLPIQEEI